MLPRTADLGRLSEGSPDRRLFPVIPVRGAGISFGTEQLLRRLAAEVGDLLPQREEELALALIHDDAHRLELVL